MKKGRSSQKKGTFSSPPTQMRLFEAPEPPRGDYSAIVLSESTRQSMMILKSKLGNSGAMLSSAEFEILDKGVSIYVRNRETRTEVEFPKASIAWGVRRA